MTDAPEYADPQRYIDLVGFQGTWRDLFWNPDFLDLTARRLRLRDVRDALDVGCGAGHWGRALFPHLHRDARLVGVDREVAFLDLARRKAAEPARTSYVKGEAEALPFPDASFDLVTCQLVLIHVREPRRALAEMRRVLRPGGVLLTAEPDNRAGNLALLGGDPRPSDDDLLLITELLLRCDRGKLSLGEGDQSIGGRLPGLLVDAGLDEVVVYTNDRCVSLYPPYDRADMRVQLEQELAKLFRERGDRWQYAVVPAGAFGLLVAGAVITYASDPGRGLTIVAAAMVALLAVGLRNSWAIAVTVISPRSRNSDTNDGG